MIGDRFFAPGQGWNCHRREKPSPAFNDIFTVQARQRKLLQHIMGQPGFSACSLIAPWRTWRPGRASSTDT
jgi:hypothetical protein